jgi:sulfur carrier protein ThiS
MEMCIPDMLDKENQILVRIVDVLRKEQTLFQRFVSILKGNQSLTKHEIADLLKDLTFKEKRVVVDLIASYLDQYGYTETKDLRDACVKSNGYEMMIKCKEYYALDANFISAHIKDNR